MVYGAQKTLRRGYNMFYTPRNTPFDPWSMYCGQNPGRSVWCCDWFKRLCLAADPANFWNKIGKIWLEFGCFCSSGEEWDDYPTITSGLRLSIFMSSISSVNMISKSSTWFLGFCFMSLQNSCLSYWRRAFSASSQLLASYILLSLSFSIFYLTSLISEFFCSSRSGLFLYMALISASSSNFISLTSSIISSYLA